MIFDQSFIQKILFRRGDIYLKNKYIYIPPLSRLNFCADGAFWFLWNLTGRRDIARENARLALSSGSNQRTEMEISHFDNSENVNLRKFGGAHPPGYEDFHPEIYFRRIRSFL